MEDGFTVGDVIAGKFRIEQELGRGGMAVVYLAHHLKLGTPLALKVMLPQFKNDPEVTERFPREARAMARLKSEHVVRVLDIDVMQDGRPYIAMEYIEGSDLAQVLSERQCLPYSEAADYICQAALALAEAHAAGVVHRDLKPGNLILTANRDGNRVVKVLDFGISKILRADLAQPITRREISMGTPSYMSPEQLRASKEVGPLSDIWALGVILYQLVTGRLPFAADSMPALCVAILDQPIPLVRDTLPLVPVTFDAIIQRCLRRVPEERFESADALREALLPFVSADAQSSNATTGAPLFQVASHPDTPGAHATPFELPVDANSGTRRWTVVGLVAISVFISLGYWFGRSKEPNPEEGVEVLKPTFGARSFPPHADPISSTPPPPLQSVTSGSETMVSDIDAGVETAVVNRPPPPKPSSVKPTKAAPATPPPAFAPSRDKGQPGPQSSTGNALGGRL